MNIAELIANIQDLCLSHKQIVQFQVGNNFDVGQAKADKYPCVWFELPILVGYEDARRKNYLLALNFLTLVKHDDLIDNMNKTSDMETVADEVIQAIDDKFTNIGISNVTAVTLRDFSDDMLSGVRVELQFTIGRQCDYKESFDKAI